MNLSRTFDISSPCHCEFAAHTLLVACAILGLIGSRVEFLIAALIFYAVYNVVLRLCFVSYSPQTVAVWTEAGSIRYSTPEEFREALDLQLQQLEDNAQRVTPDWLKSLGFAVKLGEPDYALTLGCLTVYVDGSSLVWVIGRTDGSLAFCLPENLSPANRGEARQLFAKLNLPVLEC